MDAFELDDIETICLAYALKKHFWMYLLKQKGQFQYNFMTMRAINSYTYVHIQ